MTEQEDIESVLGNDCPTRLVYEFCQLPRTAASVREHFDPSSVANAADKRTFEIVYNDENICDYMVSIGYLRKHDSLHGGVAYIAIKRDRVPLWAHVDG
jgi:hypothetical protein